MKKQESTPVADPQTAEEQQEKTNDAQKSGVEAMRDAVEKVLKTDCDKLARALADSCITGHMMAGRLLYMIATDKAKLTAEEIKQTHSLALQWAEEEEWTPEASEQIAETTAGGFEPE